MIDYHEITRRRDEHDGPEAAPVGGYRSALLPTRRSGAPRYVAFGAPSAGVPGTPRRVAAPTTWWVFDGEDGRLLLHAVGAGVPLASDLPAVDPFEVVRPGPPAAGREARAALLDAIGELGPRFLGGEQAPPTAGARILSLASAGLGRAELSAWRQAAPDFFTWCGVGD